MLGAGVSVKVATIPGLKYTLKRTDSLRRAEDVAPYQVEADKVADGSRPLCLCVSVLKSPQNRADVTFRCFAFFQYVTF